MESGNISLTCGNVVRVTTVVEVTGLCSNPLSPVFGLIKG